MANSITIPLDPQAAAAYESASPEERRKMQALVSLWLRDLATKDLPSLSRVLEEVGRKAQARGLTTEALNTLLAGD